MIDMGPATARMAALLANIDDDQFDRPTPCPKSTIGDLIDHVGSLAAAFAMAARKTSTAEGGRPPAPDVRNLEPGWRDRIAADLDTLADAWRDADAWEGMTAVGGVELPGQITGLVALDELVVHGWDLAVASGQAYSPSADEVDAAMSFVANFDAPRDGNLFG